MSLQLKLNEGHCRRKPGLLNILDETMLLRIKVKTEGKVLMKGRHVTSIHRYNFEFLQHQTKASFSVEFRTRYRILVMIQ
jgi:hypothetical protein